MLYTDLVYIVSDSDDEELHSFMQSVGASKSDMLVSNGKVYYSVWKKPYKLACLKENVIVVRRKKLRKYLRGLKLLKSVKIDFWYYKRFIQSWLILIAKHNDLYAKMGFRDKAIHVSANYSCCEAYFEDYEFNRVTFTISKQYPEGHCNYEIPQQVTDEILQNRRYLQDFKK